MSYNANTEGWLTVKGDRLIRLLQGIIELLQKEDLQGITKEELVELLQCLQKVISNELHKKN